MTREPERTVVITGRTEDGKIKEFITQPAERIDRWFPELRVIADEATRDGSLTKEKAVAEAAKKVREGAPYIISTWDVLGVSCWRGNYITGLAVLRV
ncbi:MAG: hypothetical protein DRI26_03410 [Chloroflexi bacterium]|nr:MAG: hypothetical protein DRI26_03410 [Chloroflexota bacterium]